MKIVAINAVGLVGETPKGGWTVELKPEDSVHTLIAVHTDGGLIGYGSVFTNHLLVDAALKVLAPLWQGELALEPERVTEKLAQNSFWMGMGGSITHTISGIDIALWDILGKATGQPVGRLLGGRCRSRVPLAGGEVLTRRQSFRAWFVRGALDIVQPDVTKVGGISEQRKIAWLANEFGIRYIGHGWNTALGVAADLQLASVFPDTNFVEYIGG